MHMFNVGDCNFVLVFNLQLCHTQQLLAHQRADRHARRHHHANWSKSQATKQGHSQQHWHQRCLLSINRRVGVPRQHPQHPHRNIGQRHHHHHHHGNQQLTQQLRLCGNMRQWQLPHCSRKHHSTSGPRNIGTTTLASGQRTILQQSICTYGGSHCLGGTGTRATCHARLFEPAARCCSYAARCLLLSWADPRGTRFLGIGHSGMITHHMSRRTLTNASMTATTRQPHVLFNFFKPALLRATLLGEASAPAASCRGRGTPCAAQTCARQICCRKSCTA